MPNRGLTAGEAPAALPLKDRAGAAMIAQWRSMRHDLRSPVNAIVGFLELLESPKFGPLSDRQRRYVANALGASHDLLELIDESLRHGRLDAEPLAPERAAVDPRDVLESVCAWVRDDEHRRSIEVAFHPDAASATVQGDRRLLLKACYHLIGTAAHFARPETVVNVTLARAADPEIRVEIVVSVERSDAVNATAQAFGDEGTLEAANRGTQAMRLAQYLIQLHGGRTATSWVTDDTLLLAFHLPSEG